MKKNSRFLKFLLIVILNLNEIMDFVPLLVDHEFKATPDTFETTSKQPNTFLERADRRKCGSFTFLVIVWLFKANKIPVECFVMNI